MSSRLLYPPLCREFAPFGVLYFSGQGQCTCEGFFLPIHTTPTICFCMPYPVQHDGFWKETAVFHVHFQSNARKHWSPGTLSQPRAHTLDTYAVLLLPLFLYACLLPHYSLPHFCFLYNTLPSLIHYTPSSARLRRRKVASACPRYGDPTHASTLRNTEGCFRNLSTSDMVTPSAHKPSRCSD